MASFVLASSSSNSLFVNVVLVLAHVQIKTRQTDRQTDFSSSPSKVLWGIEFHSIPDIAEASLKKSTQ